MKCPVCGDSRFPADARRRITELLQKLNCTSEAMNPGGREFWFADGSRLQVADMCDSCTLTSLEERLAGAA